MVRSEDGAGISEARGQHSDARYVHSGTHASETRSTAKGYRDDWTHVDPRIWDDYCECWIVKGGRVAQLAEQCPFKAFSTTSRQSRIPKQKHATQSKTSVKSRRPRASEESVFSILAQRKARNCKAKCHQRCHRLPGARCGKCSRLSAGVQILGRGLRAGPRFKGWGSG
jgi:hypothetical protein